MLTELGESEAAMEEVQGTAWAIEETATGGPGQLDGSNHAICR